MAKKTAKKAAKTIATALKDAATLAAQEAEEEDEEEEELDDDEIRVLTELEDANEIRWKIKRVSEPDPGYCGECSTAELSLQHIADEYGPGKYQVLGVRPNGTYYRSKRVSIAKSAKKKEGTAELIASLRTPAPQTDNSLLLAMMNSNTAVITAAMSRPERAEKEFPWKEIIAATPASLVAIKEFFASKDKDADSMEKILKLVSVVEKLKGGSDDKGSTWTDIIRDGLSSVSTMVAASRGTASGTIQTKPATVRDVSGAPERMPAAAVADQTASMVDTPQAVEPTDEMKAVLWLQEQLTMLIRRAADNRNAALYAEVFLEEMPDYIPDALISQLLGDNDWFSRLCQFDTRVEPYRGWFENFVEALLSLMNEPETETTGAAS